MNLRFLAAGAFALAGLMVAPQVAFAQTTITVGLNSAVSVPDPIFMSSQKDANFWGHVFETLLTASETMQPVPQLASGFTVSEDALTYTFALRQGVKFHNGKEMTSADVLASWERYRKMSPGASILSAVSELSAPDEYTFVVKLDKQQPLFLESIANVSFPIVILPAEEGNKEKGQVEPIGTGPYRFIEQVADDHTTIEKFADYSVDMSAPEGFNGFAGRRVATIDRIIFKGIPEAGTRVAGLQTGELTIADNLPVPAANRLVQDGGGQFVAQDVMPFSKAGVAFNVSTPPTDNVKIRQAIQAVVNAEDIMEVALEGFYRLDPSFVFDYNSYYPSNAVAKYYNQNNIEKAKRLLAEAGYKGELITILTNTSYPFMQNTALVMSEEMKAAGMNVDISIVDWPANVAALVDGAGHWNLTPGGYGAQPLVGPASWIPVIRQHSQLGTSDQVYEDLAAKLLNAPTIEERRALWEQIELHVDEQAYILPLGDRGIKVVASSSLEGYKPFYAMRFWNVTAK